MRPWLNREGSWGEIPEDSFWTKLDGPFEKYRQSGRMSRENLQKRMEYHRETYVTLEDFRYLQLHGITHVRIPVPYFIFGDREPYIGCAGWFYWNYQLVRDKSVLMDNYYKEAWDFRRCIDRGWLPEKL